MYTYIHIYIYAAVLNGKQKLFSLVGKRLSTFAVSANVPVYAFQ